MSNLDPVEIGNPAGFILDMLSEGLSANAGLRAFIDAGGAMRRQTWLRLWGETRAAVANREVMAGLDYGSLPSDDLFTDWSAGKRGTRLYQVEILSRDVGTSEVGRLFYSLTSDTVLTPDEAVAAGMNFYSERTGEGETGANQVILGGAVTGMFRMTGRPR